VQVRSMRRLIRGTKGRVQQKASSAWDGRQSVPQRWCVGFERLMLLGSGWGPELRPAGQPWLHQGACLASACAAMQAIGWREGGAHACALMQKGQAAAVTAKSRGGW
jgi:hypothetical protein